MKFVFRQETGDPAKMKKSNHSSGNNEGENEVSSCQSSSTPHPDEIRLSRLVNEQLSIASECAFLQKEINRRKVAEQGKRLTIGRQTKPVASISEDMGACYPEIISEMRQPRYTSNNDESSEEYLGEDDETLVTKPTRISTEVHSLIREIEDLARPNLKLSRTQRVSSAQIYAENVTRKRIDTKIHPLEKVGSGAVKRSVDDPMALIAPSVTVKPLVLDHVPSFDEVVRELGVPELLASQGQRPPLYIADCRILSQDLLKKLVNKRAEHLVSRLESTKVSRGTQTFVSQAGKQHVAGCVNCRSRDHHFSECQLPFRPGFCQICGAEGFDTLDCIYPHGIEHEMALGRCPGCARDLSLYCPECPDCNIRYAGLVDWLRLNYATWPTEWIPEDHRQ